MKRYKAVIAYDGTDYSGWIQQKERPSIVGTLQSCFTKVFGESIRILGASRTDAGVHALGQVALFETNIEIASSKIWNAWNNFLPPSIMIRSIVADDHFYPRYHVKQKIYYYHLAIERPLPFVTRYSYYPPYGFDPKAVEDALQLFVGTHDFSAFYTGSDRQDRIRTIDEIRLIYLEQFQLYRVVVIGEKFLRHMVRRMVGAALAAASRSTITHVAIRSALQTGKMNAKLPTAPSQGLMLWNIIYEEHK